MYKKCIKKIHEDYLNIKLIKIRKFLIILIVLFIIELYSKYVIDFIYVVLYFFICATEKIVI